MGSFHSHFGPASQKIDLSKLEQKTLTHTCPFEQAVQISPPKAPILQEPMVKPLRKRRISASAWDQFDGRFN